ncbi:MAG: hypothetical protein KA792_00965 [Bacteroidales bacterium]|nr:hypothetical protein [Bacteroidales bacterium]
MKNELKIDFKENKHNKIFLHFKSGKKYYKVYENKYIDYSLPRNILWHINLFLQDLNPLNNKNKCEEMRIGFFQKVKDKFDNIYLRINKYYEFNISVIRSEYPNKKGNYQILFKTKCSIDSFISQLLSDLENLFLSNGFCRYDISYYENFPIAEYLRLKKFYMIYKTTGKLNFSKLNGNLTIYEEIEILNQIISIKNTKN